jgi:hypothetical protein
MRYLNELILKGGVKRVSLLLAILIDSDHFFFFFYACRYISRVGLEESEGYSYDEFFYAICNMYILHSKYFCLVKL